jgi:ATP-dependent Clp protease protease subunit
MFIGNYIDGSYSNVLLATMLYLDSLDSSERLNVYINSPGGDITPTVAVYDTMQSLESPVGTNVLGHAYDLAGFLLAAGQKVISFTPVDT